jgi:ABC-type phosphate transport system auxiliary subunit
LNQHLADYWEMSYAIRSGVTANLNEVTKRLSQVKQFSSQLPDDSARNVRDSLPQGLLDARRQSKFMSKLDAKLERSLNAEIACLTQRLDAQDQATQRLIDSVKREIMRNVIE